MVAAQRFGSATGAGLKPRQHSMQNTTEKLPQPDNRAGCAVADGSAFNPRFGDRVENEWASETNPTRIGIFVEKVHDGYRMTDGNGFFWVACMKPHRLRVLPNIPVSQPVANRSQKQ